MKPSFILLGKDILLYGVLGGVSKSISLILLPVFTHQFSTEEYGFLEIIVTLVSLLAVFISLSLNSAITRFWFENEKNNSTKQLISSITFLTFLIGFFVILMTSIYSKYLAKILLNNHELYTLIIYSSFAALFNALMGIPQIVLRMQRKVVSYNLLVMLQSISYAIIAITLIFHFGMGVEGVIIAIVIANILSFLIGLLLTKNHYHFNISLTNIRESLHFSLPILPAILVTWINSQADKFILLSFLGLSVVGVFGVASKIALLIGLISVIFKQAWSPFSMSIIDDIKKRDNFYKRALNYYTGILSIIACLIITFSRDIIILIAPAEYSYGYVLVPWIIGAKILHGSASITNLGTLISKKTYGNSIAAWSGAIVNIALSISLIPFIGIWGAAIGSFCAELIFTSILLRYTLKTSDILFNIKSLLLMLISYVFMSISIILIYEYIELDYFNTMLRVTTFLIFSLITFKLCFDQQLYNSVFSNYQRILSKYKYTN